MTNIEDNLNEAIDRLNNKAAFEAGTKDPEFGKLLATAHLLASLPKKPVPQPLMQRKYLTERTRLGIWQKLLTVPRFGIAALSAVFVVSSLAGTAYAASKSLPGQTLFALKKTAEQAQLRLTTDPAKKASLQIAITQKRLQDTEKVFNQQERDPKQEIAALAELSSQTQSTLQDVKTAATNDSISQTDHPIIASLEDVTQKQQALLKQIQPDPQAKTAASDALAMSQEDQTKVDEIKKIIQVVAASKDQTLTTLTPTATSTADVASQTPTSTSGTVKGLSTTTPSKTATSSVKQDITPTATSSASTSEEEIVPLPTDTTSGTFIPEDPSPQFIP